MGDKRNTELKILEVKRGIEWNTKVLLFAVAAGRCEICNDLVIKDLFTNQDVVWGEMAHIYAFNKGGARANDTKLHDNNIKNLLLACPNCHEKIDKQKQVKYYTPEYLQAVKLEHERRIRVATSFKRQQQTKPLKMVASIATEIVSVSDFDVVSALMRERLSPCEEKFEEIDFTSTLGIDNPSYWESKSGEIEQKMTKFYADLSRNKIEHVSVFAIGPIPLLMYLGSKLNNKIKTKLFQRHRDGENWLWNREISKTKYAFKSLKEGKDKVALLLSLSGSINQDQLPESINEEYHIYELSVNPTPNYNFLRTEQDLLNFEKEFTTAISTIKSKHPGLKAIDLFPAVPAPVAVVCGRALNKNNDPQLRVFNSYSKQKFKYILTIN